MLCSSTRVTSRVTNGQKLIEYFHFSGILPSAAMCIQFLMSNKHTQIKALSRRSTKSHIVWSQRTCVSVQITFPIGWVTAVQLTARYILTCPSPRPIELNLRVHFCHDLLPVRPIYPGTHQELPFPSAWHPCDTLHLQDRTHLSPPLQTHCTAMRPTFFCITFCSSLALLIHSLHSHGDLSKITI